MILIIKKINDKIDDYYKTYEKRYSQVYEKNMLWSSRVAIHLLNNGFNVFAVGYSQTVIDKCRQLSNYKYNNHFKQIDLISDKIEEKFDYIYSIEYCICLF